MSEVVVGHGASRALSDAELEERPIPNFIKAATTDIEDLKAALDREHQRRVEAEEALRDALECCRKWEPGLAAQTIKAHLARYKE